MTFTKRYAVPCSSPVDNNDVPEFALFDIDLTTATTIIDLAQRVHANGLSSIEKDDDRVFYFSNDPLEELDADGCPTGARLDPSSLAPDRKEPPILDPYANRLRVGVDCFCFVALARHSGLPVRTEVLPIAELAAFFEIPWDFGGVDRYLEAKLGAEGEDPRFPRSDWTYEIANGDTQLPYFEWLWHRCEAEEIEIPACAFGPEETAAHYIEQLARSHRAKIHLPTLVRHLKSAEV